MSRKNSGKNMKQKRLGDDGMASRRLKVSSNNKSSVADKNGVILPFGLLLRVLMCMLPLCLFFSYHPVIKLGESESMYFELSVAEIWLVVFCIVGVVTLGRRGEFWKGIMRGWKWLAFPVWVSLSALWSLNTTRGVLTAGMIWLVMIAGYIVWNLKEGFDGEFWRRWWRWFIGSTMVVCGWCLVQCMMDIVGVGQDVTLMCDGCTYRMFGFPHPNGFAIEPQFMGNLLLAPAVAMGWMWVTRQKGVVLGRRGLTLRGDGFYGSGISELGDKQMRTKRRSFDCCKKYNGLWVLPSWAVMICFFVIVATLFLTFSRGAIYAFAVGMLFMTGLMVAKDKRGRRGMMKRVGVVWGVIILAFVAVLNLQGLMAELSPTTDTYATGVGKVLNHLSLGMIKLGSNESSYDKREEYKESAPVENFGGDIVEADGMVEAGSGMVIGKVDDMYNDEKKSNEAVFNGYVAESTDTRLRLTGAAMEVWKQNPKTMMFGVGLGGAGQALYNNNLSPAPREIIQNEYASILLETGLVGAMLGVMMIGLILKAVMGKMFAEVVLTLMVAYGVTLVFFSGIPNALQVYLMPVVIAVAVGDIRTIKLIKAKD